MTESEFNELAATVCNRIKHAIDASGAEIECNLNGPNREIRLAAQTGDFIMVSGTGGG